jgi:hypothetical protein
MCLARAVPGKKGGEETNSHVPVLTGPPAELFSVERTPCRLDLAPAPTSTAPTPPCDASEPDPEPTWASHAPQRKHLAKQPHTQNTHRRAGPTPAPPNLSVSHYLRIFCLGQALAGPHRRARASGAKLSRGAVRPFRPERQDFKITQAPPILTVRFGSGVGASARGPSDAGPAPCPHYGYLTDTALSTLLPGLRTPPSPAPARSLSRRRLIRSCVVSYLGKL